MKNLSTYIIARINKKHSQNIEDTSSELFQQALMHCNSPTQLLIYRREALMYYLYVRKLNGTGDCFGMCAVVNSWMATDIPQLFGIFEEVFADVVAKGKILTLNKAGDIIAKGEDLKQLPLETHQLSEQLRNKLSHYSAGTILPPADMSTNYGDFRQHELENLTPEDIRQTSLHGWTAIYKRKSASIGFTEPPHATSTPFLKVQQPPSMKEAFISAFKNYSNFSGRARRSEYWWFALANLIIYIIGVVIGSLFAGATGNTDALLIGLAPVMIYYLIAFIPQLALNIRRLHDTGHSGWWLLIGLVPYLGAFILLYFGVQDSAPNENEWGKSPKYVQ